jgi:hypothetical protein
MVPQGTSSGSPHSRHSVGTASVGATGSAQGSTVGVVTGAVSPDAGERPGRRAHPVEGCGLSRPSAAVVDKVVHTVRTRPKRRHHPKGFAWRFVSSFVRGFVLKTKSRPRLSPQVRTPTGSSSVGDSVGHHGNRPGRVGAFTDPEDKADPAVSFSMRTDASGLSVPRCVRRPPTVTMFVMT